MHSVFEKWNGKQNVTMIGDSSGNLIIINYNVQFFENINMCIRVF
jgi:hypothetical protein